jgi:hypothetical protein
MPSDDSAAESGRDVSHDGTLIKAASSLDPDAPEWHHSVEFDGYDHTTACGRTIAAGDDVDEVLLEIPDGLETGNTCPNCKDATLGGESA